MPSKLNGNMLEEERNLKKKLNLIPFSSFPAWACVQFGKLLGVTFEVRGLENINRKKGAVVLINHQSGIDLMGESLTSIL